MKRIILIITISLLSVKLFACSCLYVTINKSVADAELIFTGKVLRVDTVQIVLDFFIKEKLVKEDSLYNYATTQYLVTLSAINIFKGKLTGSHIIILTGQGGGDCGYDFKPGKSYVIYSRKNDYNVIDQTMNATR